MKSEREDTATNPSPDPTVLGTPDAVAITRALPLVEPGTVPTPPQGFRLSDAEIKRALLKLPEQLRAEALSTLAEAADKGAQLQLDLGRYAPTAEQAEAILQRARVARAGQNRAQALLTYYQELEDINNHDAMTFIVNLRREFLHTAERAPEMEAQYPELAALIAQRREIVAEGRARARNEKVPAPPTTPPAPANGQSR